ncbi:MAG: hypothetical protein KAS32_19040 [Candidatus Peribacteraceae bacterium]|nr:hypothetical protein [Candidatus Peribacteraceae bacterium]
MSQHLSKKKKCSEVECLVIRNGCKASELPTGSVVLVEVMRCSSSHGSWCQIRNQHHGYYNIHGIVIEKFDGNKDIKMVEEELNTLRAIKGSEQFSQVVMLHHYNSPFEAVMRIVTRPNIASA